MSYSQELSVTTIFSCHGIQYHLAGTVNNLSVYFHRRRFMSKLEWQLIACTVCIAPARACSSHVREALVPAATGTAEKGTLLIGFFRGAPIAAVLGWPQDTFSYLPALLSASGEPARQRTMDPLRVKFAPTIFIFQIHFEASQENVEKSFTYHYNI